jgi:hypothetical protein
MTTSKWAIPVGFALVMVICWIVSWKRIAVLDELRKSGVQTEAHVTDKQIRSGKSRTYRLEYAFDLRSGVQTGSAKVSRSQYEDTQRGDSLLITYLPREPGEQVLGAVDEERVDGLKRTWQWAYFGITLVGALLYGLLMRTYKWQVELLRNGVVADARIISSDLRSTGKSTSRRLTFEFETEPGRLQTGTARVNGSPSYARVGEVVPYVFPGDTPLKGRLVPTLTLAHVQPGATPF